MTKSEFRALCGLGAMRILKTGDPVFITYQKRTVEASVLLASGNGKSLFVIFEAILGGYVGKMPLLMEDDGEYRDLLMGEVATITHKEDHNGRQ